MHLLCLSFPMLASPNLLWTESTPLTAPRSDMAAVSAPWNAGGVWVLGGVNGVTVSNVDVLGQEQLEWVEGPALPYPVSSLAATTITYVSTTGEPMGGIIAGGGINAANEAIASMFFLKHHIAQVCCTFMEHDDLQFPNVSTIPLFT